MTIPTSGTYRGIYVYPVSTLADLGTAADTAIGVIDGLLGTPLLLDLALFGQPSASGVEATFSGTDITFTNSAGVQETLTDGSGGTPAPIAQGTGAFEFASATATGPQDFIVSDGALTGAISLDATLAGLATNALLNPAVTTLQGVIAGTGLGGLLVVPAGEFGTGAYQPPCFVTGTRILTPDGERPVEALRVGDLVTLATGIEAEIRWIGNRRLSSAADRPVRVLAGALAPGVPRRDLVVSPDHALFIDQVLVPAGLLVNGDTIRREDDAPVTYYHVELDAHGVLLAEGAPAESYLDTGNRRQFANCSLHYDPIEAAQCDPCAEVLFGGPRLDAIRARRVFA